MEGDSIIKVVEVQDLTIAPAVEVLGVPEAHQRFVAFLMVSANGNREAVEILFVQ